MTIGFRNSASVTNGTAGTSVVVSKAAGIVDGDQLIAFIASQGAPTFTAPSGWVLLATATATNVTFKAYRKLAAAEGASWTWTLGSSQRNWGWVGGYTGVDPSAPIVSTETDVTLDGTSTILTLDQLTLQLVPYGASVSAAAAVRSASGVATTWTHSSPNERADLSTNVGAGTDIAGVVGDRLWNLELGGPTAPGMTASQTQSAGVAIGLTLNPYFVPYTGNAGDAGIVLEAAFGVDPDSESADWTWTDLTSRAHKTGQLVLTHGRANATALADPSSITFTLINNNGEFTHPAGLYTRYMVRNLPFRVRLNGFGAGGTDGYHRGTAFLASMRPRFDDASNTAVVDVVAQGRLRRVQQRSDPLHSPAFDAIMKMASDNGPVAPIAYWPFEDQSGATSAASPIPGVSPATVTAVTFAGDDSVIGSAPLAVLSAASAINATVPAYTDTGTWTVMFATMVPAEPSGAMTLVDTITTGTAPGWSIGFQPGSPSTFYLQVYDSGGAAIFTQTIGVDEPNFFGQGAFVWLTATQNGTSVDIALNVAYESPGGQLISNGFVNSLASRTAGLVTRFRVPTFADHAGLAFGHLAVHVEPGADVSSSGVFFVVVEGNAGDWPATRFQRMCEQLGVPYKFEFSDNTQLEMGPQGVDTFIAQVREAEAAEGCVVNDSGEFLGASIVPGEFFRSTGRLWFPSRDDRENIPATLTLNVALDQVALGFSPAFDDQDIVNDVEVTRQGGSSARVTDEASIAVEGRYREQITLNLNDDTQLQHLAGWRVNLGTVRGMRFPTVGWNMRGAPELARQWLATRLFNRIDITNPPSQFPPDPIQAILEGYVEVLSAEAWYVAANLSPYAPNKVFLLASDTADAGEYVGRLAGDPQAAIRADITSTATSIPFDPNSFRWTTAADDFNPNLRVRLTPPGSVVPGELVGVSGVSTTAATFVAAGAASHADNANVTPAMYAGGAAGDLILVLARIRGTAGSVTIATEYSRIAQVGNTHLFAKVHDGSEPNPTVVASGGSAGDTVSALTFGFRNMPVSLDDLTDLIVGTVPEFSNASAQNIAYPGVLPLLDGCVLLLIAGKSDDWTSVAVPAGWTEIAEPSTVTGNDQGLYAAYQIQTAPTVANDGSLVVTGGASAVSEAAVLVLAGGFQTMTVTRSLNGLVKSHTAGTRIEVEDALALGM